ncbi:MAG: amidohydrolase [Ignavibacteria bacterium]|nr:amidohydrolase [Ignavibacteria bacterium]
MKLNTVFRFFLAVVLIFTAQVVFAQNADYVFKNGAIYTIDEKNPKAEAIAINGKLISYVGSNNGADAYIGKDTKVIDLKGQMLLPGFVESHIHPSMAILTNGADLQTDSMEELLSRVKAWADANPDSKIIRGFGWRYNMFSTTGPTKEVLDKIFPDKPVFLIAIDGHSAWVNSKALQMSGIEAKHPDPLPGVSYYQRDPKTNEPTGWVVETLAEQEMFDKLKLMTPDLILNAIKDILPKFSAAGITSAFDAGIAIIQTENVLEQFVQMEKEGKLPIRIVASYFWNNASVTDPVERTMALKEKFKSELLQVGALKIMFDGGEAQHTAVMIQEYADRPGFFGDYSIDKKLIEEAILKAEANNINTHAHSYGDATTRAYLDAIEAAQKMYPNSTSRHTAAHVMFLADSDVPRFAKLNVTMQCSAQWMTPDPPMERTAQIVGNDIAFKELNRINSVLKTGGRVAFGTDWPAAGYVSTFQPLDAIQVAVTRMILQKYGNDYFTPVLPPVDEIVTLDQALKAYTLDAAYVLGLEEKIGSLQVGKLADIVVLEKDLHNIKPGDISGTKIKLTMMNGKITFQTK